MLVRGRCGGLGTRCRSDGQASDGSGQYPHQGQDESAFHQGCFSTSRHNFLQGPTHVPLQTVGLFYRNESRHGELSEMAGIR